MAKGMSGGCWTIFKATRQGAEERVIRGVQMYRELTSAGWHRQGRFSFNQINLKSIFFKHVSVKKIGTKNRQKSEKSRQKWVKNRQKLVWPPRPRVGSCSLAPTCGWLQVFVARSRAAAARGWQEVSGGCQVRLLMELYECGAVILSRQTPMQVRGCTLTTALELGVKITWHSPHPVGLG